MKSLNARTIFLKRTSMTRYVKMNYMHDRDFTKDMWKCDSCQVSIDSMSHVLWCPCYVELRRDKNMNDDVDLARYLHRVMTIRSKMNLDKWILSLLIWGCHCPAQARPLPPQGRCVAVARGEARAYSVVWLDAKLRSESDCWIFVVADLCYALFYFVIVL